MDAPLRILLDPGQYDMRNKGMVALLQVAISRVQQLWPGAALDVLTLSPLLLRYYCPSARPVFPSPANERAFESGPYRWVDQFIPRWGWGPLFELREAYWRSRPGKFLKDAPGGLGNLPPCPPGETNLAMISGYDLFIAAGSQYMSDPCRDEALCVLDRLEAASSQGIPTAMVGQEFGPITDPTLKARSKEVLPLVDLIFIRNRITSPGLLDSFGVDPDRVFLTGDDAIEMVYAERASAWGNGIGFGLRAAEYTGVDRGCFTPLHRALAGAAGELQAQFLPIPISYSAHELDDQVIRKVLSGMPRVIRDGRRFRTPVESIRQVGKCRVVVAGAFHALVFALAQGIPAIGLARSRMYQDKFAGLADLFGPGFEIIRLDEKDLEAALRGCIREMWHSAEKYRPGLLAAAKTQIDWGQQAYRRLVELVPGKN